jgi:PREDICTED: hypothetical protein isoform 1
LKKNQVDKHLHSCLTDSVCCIDCGKDFYGFEYQKHTLCISEDQKYGGDNFKLKENAFKGRKKQQEWVQKVKLALSRSSVPKRIEGMIQKLTEYDNIPRKKPKFINFVKSSLKLYNTHDIDTIWTLFSAANLNQSNDNQNTQKSENKDLNQVDFNRDKRKDVDDSQEVMNGDKKKAKVTNDNDEEGKEKREKEKEEDEEKASMIKQSDDVNEVICLDKRWFKKLKKEIKHSEEGIGKSSLKKLLKNLRKEFNIGLSNRDFYKLAQMKLSKRKNYQFCENRICYIKDSANGQ